MTIRNSKQGGWDDGFQVESDSFADSRMMGFKSKVILLLILVCQSVFVSATVWTNHSADWVISPRKDTFINLQNISERSLLINLHFLREKATASQRPFRLLKLRLEPHSSLRLAVKSLTKLSLNGDLSGRLRAVGSTRNELRITVEAADFATGERSAKELTDPFSKFAEFSEFSVDEPIDPCADPDTCQDGDPFPPGQAGRYEYTAFDINDDGFPDNAFRADAYMFDENDILYDSAVLDEPMFEPQVEEAPLVDSLTCGSFTASPAGPDCFQRACQLITSDHIGIVAVSQFDEVMCNAEPVSEDSITGEVIPVPLTPQQFYDECFDNAVEQFLLQAPGIVAATNREVENRVLAVAAFWSASAKMRLVSILAADIEITGVLITKISALSALNTITMNFSDLFRKNYGVACNFINSEQFCWQRTFNAFGAVTFQKASSTQIDAIISGQDITARFARKICPPPPSGSAF